jgi:GTP-binding protein
MPFTVAIVGRPNVGKSTLFNRLVGRREAIVEATPGVTRDRRVGEAKLADLRFQVIDTAGLDEAQDESLEARMRAQTEQALAEADLALLLVDARAGVTPLDQHFANWLRRGATPIVLVANKCEGRASEAGLYDAYSLGLGEPVAISAERGEGLADLYAALAPRIETAGLAEAAEAEVGDGVVQLAIVGRPNVGKSTLVNRLIGDERMLTGPEPGVTRDAIAIEWTYADRRLRLVDTAGLRRRAQVVERLEKLSVEKTLRAIRFAQVVVLVLDAEAMLERQDLTIARMVEEEGRALVIAANKWDLVADRKAALARLRDRLETSLPQLKGVPCVTLSALTGRNLDRLMETVFGAYDRWNRRVPTSVLNDWLNDVLERHPPPAPRGRRLRLRYITQAKARPPTFALFVSRPKELPDSYLRYLTNGLREAFDLPGVPIRILLRRGRNPYTES